MTVGVAILCEDGKSAVVAADWLVSFGDFRVDSDCIKIRIMSPNVLWIRSGSSSYADLFTDSLNGEVVPTAHEAAQRLKTFYDEARQVALDDFLRKLGFSSKAFGKIFSKQTENTLLSNSVAKFCFLNGSLVAGIDGTGSHIYRIDEEGITKHDHPGFAAIGTRWNMCYPVCIERKAHNKFR